jgi:excisionase family DNA binding protein
MPPPPEPFPSMKPFAGRAIRIAISRYPRDMPEDTSPLFVRLPRHEADLLDRAAFEGRTSKRELVTTMVKRYLDEKPPQPELVLGRAELRPSAAPEVLTIEQAAALLQVEPAEVEALAEAGELPGRKLGDAWRFPRTALLDWLAAR